MLDKALNARVPLIAAASTDPVNDLYVVAHFAENAELTMVKAGGNGISVGENQLIVLTEDAISNDLSDLYSKLAHNGSVLLWLLGDDDPPPGFYDVGAIPVPTAMVVDLVDAFVPEGSVNDVVQAVAGLNLSEIDRLLRMTPVIFKELTPYAVARARSQLYVTASGLSGVIIKTDTYVPGHELKEWTLQEAPLLLKAPTAELRPRGLLFDGPAGTGKTSGAKYIADSLKVPLYRIDISSMMGKWLGESEQRLRTALQTVENAPPCVVLFDEIEKIMGSHDNDSVSRMLSYLLWWLQEHDKAILSIMTTNNKDSLPPELFRPGRVDQIITFKALHFHDAEILWDTKVAALRHKIPSLPALPYGFDSSKEVTPAEITAGVIKSARKALNE